jgi:hypothetical protein
MNLVRDILFVQEDEKMDFWLLYRRHKLEKPAVENATAVRYTPIVDNI